MSADNLVELQRFRACWLSKDKGNVRRTGLFVINAKITYKSPKFADTGISEVTINFDGYEAGSIEISETEIFGAVKCHLGFCDYDGTDYLLDEDSDALVIEGSSTKLGGEYIVRIYPV